MNKNLIKNYKRTRKRDGNFYGTPGVEVEFYGGRGPEFYSATIFYKGYEFNYFDVEDELYDMCKEEYGKKADDDDFFERYVQKNVKHLLDEMIYTGEVEKEDSYKDTRRKHDDNIWHYYYVDHIPSDTDEEIQEYKDEEEFMKGLLWNRDIAEENGDTVVDEEKLIKMFSNNKEVYYENLNGADFYKTKKTKEQVEKELYGINDSKKTKRDFRRKPMRRDVRTTLHGSKRARKERDTLRNRKPLREHDSITKEKTFIVKARNEKDAVLKLKRYLKK